MNIFLYKNDLPDDFNENLESIAIDTETMGLWPHRDRLCLTQFSKGDGNCYLVQFENYKVAKNISEILASEKILKIFHYGRFDIMMLYKYLGVMTNNVYCTKIASKLARTYTSRHSLLDLCRDLLNIEISKEQTCTDWGNSELTEEQKTYAATDVLYLHKIKEKLDVMLKREGREHIAQKCFDFLETRVIFDLMVNENYDIFSHSGVWAMTDFLSEAKRVIKEEADSLYLLADELPLNFEKAVDLIFKSKGRLVVSGIGKSGHIGRKISSTMASLGQKSFFMHPSEAQHGDLGMLDFDDILLLISYSGESVELLPVIDFAKRSGIKIISISKSSESSLAKNSDVSLSLPNVKEACPLGIAPTVSSTMTLALGDAIAVALLTKRGFSKEQFKRLHPGGALGKSLSFVFDIMHKEMPLINSKDSMQDGIISMTHFGFGCVGVIDDSDKLIGIITDGDLRRNMSPELLSKNVADIMTQNPIVISNNMLVSELLFMMEQKKITNIFVLNENNIPIGIVHIHDILLRKIV